jgi:hypothetical protein
MTQSPEEKNGMNEQSRMIELDTASEPRTHQTARRVGIEALEVELHGEKPTDAVDISIYVRGRMVATTTNSATVARIMAILTGLSD